MVNIFSDLWANAALIYTNHPVIVSADDGSKFSYEDVDTLISAMISYLHRFGLRQGDKILIHADNHPEYLFTLWASLRLGLVVVPVDYTSTKATLDKIVKQVDPSFICCDYERLERLGNLDANVLIFDEQVEKKSNDRRAYSVQIENFIGVPLPSIPELDGSELAAILFTSGSTGIPKGVMLSQGALIRSGSLMAAAYGWNQEDTLMGLGAMHVMSGLRNQAMTALHSGTTIIVATSRYRAFAPVVAELCSRHNITIITTVPAFLHDLIREQKRWKSNQIKQVRMIMITGAGLDQKSATKVAKLIDTAVYSYYGLTETCGLCCYVPLDNPRQGDGIIGIPIGVEIDVVDEKDKSVLEDNTGELIIRGDNLMMGYFSQTDHLEQNLRDGWFYTGDLVRRRNDGLLYLNGRKDDRIKSRSGEIIYPDEVARSIQCHECVLNAFVCSIETKDFQEALFAFIVLEKSSTDNNRLREEIIEFLYRKIGTTIIPDNILFCKLLPVSSSGKIDKRKLIKEYLSEYKSE